jgi:DNA polymerase
MGLRLWIPPAAAETDGPVAQLVAADTPALLAAAPAPMVQRRAPPSLQPPPAAVSLATPPAAMSSAAAQLDWPELRAAVAGCRACGLCESRRQTVFGVGHPRAHCMVVGEAPGEQEDAEGEPFVGAAGQLLDRMLAAMRLERGTAASSSSAAT